MAGTHGRLTPPSQGQVFARDQGKAFTTGPYQGGYVFVLTGNVGAAGTVTFNHPLRVVPRHVEVISTIASEYPSRVCFSASSAASVTVKFESAQSTGGVLWIW